MVNNPFLRRVLAIRSVPTPIVVLTAVASYLAQISAIIQGWPLWAIAVATLLPWIPLFTLEMVWTYRHYQWLALFYILVITQGGHVIEHVAQMVQIHLLGLRGAAARGIIGPLDIEWVHFIWNSWVLLAVLLLLVRFRRNPWLWATLVIAGWHELEHAFIMTRYLATGVAGPPGLLSRGGALAGGLPVSRPDLHFLYNIVETAPLVIAFVYQLERTYDEWLRRALPHLPEPMLAEATSRIQMVRVPAGETIIRQGDLPDRFYVITHGEVTVTQKDGAGQERELATMGPGQHFGEIGLLSSVPRTATVRAKTAVELLAMDRETFHGLVERSEATAEQLEEIARRRIGTTVR